MKSGETIGILTRNTHDAFQLQACWHSGKLIKTSEQGRTQRYRYRGQRELVNAADIAGVPTNLAYTYFWHPHRQTHAPACTSLASRGGGGGSAPRPGQFFFCLIGSQWGIQDFDKGGPPKKKVWPRYARHDLFVSIYYTYTHNKHSHKLIAINTRLYVLFYSNTCWNPGFRGIMHLHKKWKSNGARWSPLV